MAKKVVIVGGGYSGLTTALMLARQTKQAIGITLIDSQPSHVKLTHLHKSIHNHVSRYQVPFTTIARDHGINFVHGKAEFGDGPELHDTFHSRTVTVAGDEYEYDYLVIATGAVTYDFDFDSGAVIRLADLVETPVMNRLKSLRANQTISIIGGGATAIQFVFEIEEFLKRRNMPIKIRLINMEDQLVSHLPGRFHEYIESKLRRRNIVYDGGTRFITQTGNTLLAADNGNERELQSDLTFLFPGVTATPFELHTNPKGLVHVKNAINNRIFSGGDCSRWDGKGLNVLSAQAAVRKGKQIAQNIIRSIEGKPLLSYNYQELGYFISLGSLDGIGWIFSTRNVLTGLPAFVIKEAIEAQFELYLQGIDTYVI